MMKSENNIYEWNTTLRFSWGHIVAFISIICISYLVFMGVFCSNFGNIDVAVASVVLIDIFLLLTFIGAQALKSCNRKFEKKIKRERLLILFGFVCFLIAMIPCNRFWNFNVNKDDFNAQIERYIDASRKIFANYEDYSNQRISAYRKVRRGSYENEAYVRALELQLLYNEKKLKQSVYKWLDEVKGSITVWNAYKLSGLDERMEVWNSSLTDYARNVLPMESAVPFTKEKSGIRQAETELAELKDMFARNDGFNLITAITGILFYIMLILPYLIQDRNTKSDESLWPFKSKLKKKEYAGNVIIIGPEDEKDRKGQEGNDDIYNGIL